MLKVLWLPIFLLFFQSGLFGQVFKPKEQSADNQINARHHIGNLKKGFLLVRLESYARQVEFYTTRISRTEIPQEEKSKLERLRAQVIAERDTFNNFLMKEIADQYKFSGYRFIYDIDYRQSDTAHNNRHFLNNNFDHDASLAMGDKPYLVFGRMNYNTTAGTPKQNFLVTDAALERIKYPFPYRYTDLGFTLSGTMPKLFTLSNGIKDIVRRLNKRLEKFYETG